MHNSCLIIFSASITLFKIIKQTWHYVYISALVYIKSSLFVGIYSKVTGVPRPHHNHLPPWIRSFDLFRHRRIAIVSWGVHDLFFLEVFSWGRVLGFWCFPYFQGRWSSFVCIWVSRLVFQRSLVLSLWLRSYDFASYFIQPCVSRNTS